MVKRVQGCVTVLGQRAPSELAGLLSLSLSGPNLLLVASALALAPPSHIVTSIKFFEPSAHEFILLHEISFDESVHMHASTFPDFS